MLLQLLLSSALAASAAPAPPASVLAGEGRRCELPGKMYFTYQFASHPQMGTVILKVQVFTPDGKRDTSLKLSGRSGMPAMAKEHDSGDQPFQLNRKGDYLLPVDVVMPGDWEILLSFIKDKRKIYRGKVQIKI